MRVKSTVIALVYTFISSPAAGETANEDVESFMATLEFLGQWQDADGELIDPESLDAVLEWEPQPATEEGNAND